MMDQRHYRIKCVSVDGAPDSYTYVFDLTVADGKTVKGRTYLGFSKVIKPAAKKAAETYPFILDQDGKMDFGSGFEDEVRFLTTNVLTKHISIGETFTVWDDGEQVYRIVEMHAV